MKRVSLGLVMALSSVAPAVAQFHTYSSWERMPPESRTAYVAGVVDSYAYFSKALGSDRAQARAELFYECIRNSGMTSAQLAENIRIFAGPRPAIHTGSFVGALIDYLVVACRVPVAN